MAAEIPDPPDDQAPPPAVAPPALGILRPLETIALALLATGLAFLLTVVAMYGIPRPVAMSQIPGSSLEAIERQFGPGDALPRAGWDRSYTTQRGLVGLTYLGIRVDSRGRVVDAALIDIGR